MQMPWEIPAPQCALHARTNIRLKGWMRRAIGRTCPHCAVVMSIARGWNAPEAPSRDHRIPLSRGGPNTLDNILICCRQCNVEKGALTEEEWAAVRAGLASRLDIAVNARRSIEMNPEVRRKRPARALVHSVGDDSPRSPFDALKKPATAPIEYADPTAQAAFEGAYRGHLGMLRVAGADQTP